MSVPWANPQASPVPFGGMCAAFPMASHQQTAWAAGNSPTAQAAWPVAPSGAGSQSPQSTQEPVWSGSASTTPLSQALWAPANQSPSLPQYFGGQAPSEGSSPQEGQGTVQPMSVNGTQDQWMQGRVKNINTSQGFATVVSDHLKAYGFSHAYAKIKVHSTVKIEERVMFNVAIRDGGTPEITKMFPIDDLPGRIKSFNKSKGFGFIEVEVLKEYGFGDVFLHKSRLGSFGVGSTVLCALRFSGKGQPQAMNLKPVPPSLQDVWDSRRPGFDLDSLPKPRGVGRGGSSKASRSKGHPPLQGLPKERSVGRARPFSVQKGGYPYVECRDFKDTHHVFETDAAQSQYSSFECVWLPGGEKSSKHETMDLRGADPRLVVSHSLQQPQLVLDDQRELQHRSQQMQQHQASLQQHQMEQHQQRQVQTMRETRGSGGGIAAGSTLVGAVEHTYTGTIKSFNAHKGFGFIDCEALKRQGYADVFLHRSQLGHFRVGSRVDFSVRLNDKGQPQAACLRPLPDMMDHRFGVGGQDAFQQRCMMCEATNPGEIVFTNCGHSLCRQCSQDVPCPE